MRLRYSVVFFLSINFAIIYMALLLIQRISELNASSNVLLPLLGGIAIGFFISIILIPLARKFGKVKH